MHVCDTVRTIPQLKGGTCWFNALITALFYSDGMSMYLKKVIPEVRKKTRSDKKKEILDLFEELLNAREITDARKFFGKFYDVLKPKNLLRFLHQRDKAFYFNPNIQEGHNPGDYLIILFQFLGIKEKILFLTLKNGKYYYSFVNDYSSKGVYHKNKDRYKLDFEKLKIKPPSHYVRDPRKYDHTRWMAFDYNAYDLVVISEIGTIGHIVKGYDKNEFPLSIDKNELHVFGIPFVSDSLIFGNFNVNVCKKAHMIAGITCKEKKFVYNGWVVPRTEFSFIPYKSCSLFPFDWMKVKSHFCFERGGCAIKKTRKVDKEDMCFNVNRMRTYIYVKKTHITKRNKPECKDGKVRNPASGRCVKKLPNAKVVPVAKNKPPCKDGKVRNPASGRCVKKLPNAAPKSVPKVAPRVTPVKSKVVKPECKDGKVRNPVTGRCVKKLPVQ